LYSVNSYIIDDQRLNLTQIDEAIRNPLRSFLMEAVGKTKKGLQAIVASLLPQTEPSAEGLRPIQAKNNAPM